MINAAIETLELEIGRLTKGVNNIANQTEDIDRLETHLKEARAKLAADKSSLLQLQNALELLKAGEQ